MRARPGAALVALLVGVTGAAGCGKKLPPEPPILVLPARPQPLEVTQDGSDAVLRFPYPSRTMAGAPLTELTKVTIFREVMPAPAQAQAPAPAEKASDREREVRLFRQRAERRMELTPRDLGERTIGTELIVRDSLRDLFEGRRLGKVFLRYGVSATRDRRRESPLSPLVAIRPLSPPDAPFAVSATVEEGRVCVEWTGPAASADGVRPAAAAFAVYRREPPPFGTEDDPVYDRPAAVVAKPPWIDTGVETGKRYVYLLRGAPAATGPLVLGPPSEEVLADIRDVFPPPAPEGLLVLREVAGVRLLWNPVTSPDLAGYEVSRRKNDGRWERLGPLLKEASFFDGAAPAGPVRYGVAAVDQAGNRGARAEAGAPAASERDRR